MNVILVDTPVKKISCVDVGPTLTLSLIYSLIGCECFASYPLYDAQDHIFYCDDEAILKRPLPPAFLLDNYLNPFYGRILIFKTVGSRETSPIITVEDVFSMVFFLP